MTILFLAFSCSIFEYCDEVKTIKIGVDSGYNPKRELLTITSDECLYSTNFDKRYYTIDTKRSITYEEWDELINLLDIDKFTAIILDDVSPFDGWDDFIIVETGSITHQIRFHYWYDDQEIIEFYERDEIRDVQPFVEKLIKIRDTFRE